MLDSAYEPILKFKKILKDQKRRGLALDIDQTLADSSIHYFNYMLSFHVPDNENRDELFNRFRNLPLGAIDGWNTLEAKQHFEIALRSESFQEEMPLIPDVHASVMKLSKIYPILAYITARPESVHQATDRWLTKHHFLPAPLFTQPIELFNPLTASASWKATVLKELYPGIIGIVDDNIYLAKELHKMNYRGMLYLYGKEAANFEDLPHVTVCPTWNDVLKAVREHKGAKS